LVAGTQFFSEASTDGTWEFAVFDQARRDLHDVAAMPLLHLCDGELRDVKEAREVDAQHSA